MFIHLFLFRLLLYTALPSTRYSDCIREYTTRLHLYVNEPVAQHISFGRLWNRHHLRVPSTVSLIRFPSLEDQQGRYRQLLWFCMYLTDDENSSQNWTMDYFSFPSTEQIFLPVKRFSAAAVNRAQLRSARVLFTTVRAATLVVKHIMQWLLGVPWVYL